jgi:hypothetical protein
MAGQNKASMRKKLRSALAHKKLADELLDSILDSQTKWNSAMDKLQADNPASLDVNYASTQSVTDVFEADGENHGSQHKASLRASLRSALAHRQLADEICDSLEEWQTAFNAMLVKLDTEAGTLNDINYYSSLGVQQLDQHAESEGVQHKASLRTSLRSALANASLADAILNALEELQSALNAELVLLDSGVVAGSAGNKVVEIISPDAE